MYRIMWIKICGMQIHLWHQVFFEAVASKFGKVLILFECSGDATDLSYVRVCILAKQDQIINQCMEVR